MDFSDGRARCVVVTGIPYAPAMDAKVRASVGRAAVIRFSIFLVPLYVSQNAPVFFIRTCMRGKK